MSHAKKGTVTEAVLNVLEANPLRWFTMREIADHIAACGPAPTMNAVASALANVESGCLDVDRRQRPMRYRVRLRLRAL